MDEFAAVFKYGAPWLLVVMGGIVSVYPPERSDRRRVLVWIFAFAVVGGLVTTAQVYSDYQDRIAREILEKKLTGEGGFAIIRAQSGRKIAAGFPLSLHSAHYISGVQIDLYHLDSGQKILVNLPIKKRLDIQDETVNFPLVLPAGKWEFDFRSRFNNWDQILILEEKHNVLSETIEARRRGEQIPFYADKKNYPINEAR